MAFTPSSSHSSSLFTSPSFSPSSHELQLTLQNSSSQPIERLELELERRPGGPQLLSCRAEQLQQQLPLAAGAAARLTVTVTAGCDFVMAQEEEDEGGLWRRGGGIGCEELTLNIADFNKSRQRNLM